MSAESPPIALARVITRNRRRYGGYIAHAGLALLLIGVAASSSFQHSHEVSLAPGQSASVDGYLIRYVRPLAAAAPGKLSFGAVLDVSKRGHHVTTLTTNRRFYPASADPTAGPVSIAFNGSSDSEIGLRAGLTRDIWAVINPNLQPLQPEISKGDRVFTKLMTSLSPAQARQPETVGFIATERQRAISGLASRFIAHPWAVQFLLIVSPLVTWIWLGATIIALGGLIALWPVPVLSRSRARARVAAPRSAAPAPAKL